MRPSRLERVDCEPPKTAERSVTFKRIHAVASSILQEGFWRPRDIHNNINSPIRWSGRARDVSGRLVLLSQVGLKGARGATRRLLRL